MTNMLTFPSGALRVAILFLRGSLEPRKSCAQRMGRRPAPARTSAPDIVATVAPFRAWRDLRLVVAKKPVRATIENTREVAERVGFEPTYTCEDVTGIPVQRLRPLGHLSSAARMIHGPFLSRRLRSRLRHGVRRRSIQARVVLLARRRRRLVQLRNLERLAGIRGLQPGRDFEGRSRLRRHIDPRLVAGSSASQGSACAEQPNAGDRQPEHRRTFESSCSHLRAP